MVSGCPQAPVGEAGSPAWVRQAVVYGLAPHNVGPEGLRSVTARLDYLQELGIAALWLSPIFVTPEGGHGYGVGDYFEVRPDYGSKADLRELVQAAHARGMRVLLDLVPNHTSSRHPYFLDAQARGPASPYYSYYDRDAAGNPTHYFHWTHLPNLDYNSPEVRHWMTEVSAYWVREFDVDGYRVDSVWGIRQRRPAYLPGWCRAMRRIKPDVLLLAEASARDPYYFSHGFDAAYDWTDELGHWAWERVFEDASLLTARLHAALTNEGRGYHPSALIFRSLNNNDTGPRFITRYGLEMARVAAALLLTLPGLPCIYLGEEVGAEFEPYKQGGPVAWEDSYGLCAYYRQLIALRRRIPALHSRHWQPLAVRPAERVYAYLRTAEAGDQAVLVVLNFGEEVAAEVELPQGCWGAGRALALTDVLAGERLAVPEGGRCRVAVAPWSARVLVRDDAAQSLG